MRQLCQDNSESLFVKKRKHQIGNVCSLSLSKSLYSVHFSNVKF